MESLSEKQNGTLTNKVNAMIVEKSEQKLNSFAEQYLEPPVMNGISYDAKVTITCCTFRNIPTIDDF